MKIINSNTTDRHGNLSLLLLCNGLNMFDFLLYKVYNKKRILGFRNRTLY